MTDVGVTSQPGTVATAPMPSFQFDPPYYPIVYVRGFAPTAGSREANFHDLYYGYADTSVEARGKSPADSADPNGDRISLDMFEGQLIRFIKEYGYVDASHGGLELATTPRPFIPAIQNPTRSIWISRFYDQDYLQGKVRTIDLHAQDLWTLIDGDIRSAFGVRNVPMDDFKVILIAHSMGGLVCRTLIQCLLPGLGIDPKSIIHRLVTIATPHAGIEMSAIPDAFQNFVVNTFNPGDSGIFKEPQMRQYLCLGDQNNDGTYKYALNSLGDPAAHFAFPVDRCFCLIGSDYHSYSVVQELTGGYSDGLVKQDRAFIEGAYTANVHRAHSGYRGIVNSYESYENVHRFLFGDTSVKVELNNIAITGIDHTGSKDFYNFEFSLSVRNTGVYLHQRREDPCENAIRCMWNEIPQSLHLHTAFLSSRRREIGNDPYLYFMLSLRVVEHRVSQGLLWDHEYPGRTIYSESLEIRVNADAVAAFYQTAVSGSLPPVDILQYQWLSDGATDPQQGWQNAPFDGDSFLFDVRAASSLSGQLRLTPNPW